MLIRKIRTKKFSTKLANKINWANQYINCVTIEYIQTCHRETIQPFDQFTELVFPSLIYFFVSSFLQRDTIIIIIIISNPCWNVLENCTLSYWYCVFIVLNGRFMPVVPFFSSEVFFSLFQSIVTTTTCVHYCERQRFSVFFSSHFLNEDEQIFPS